MSKLMLKSKKKAATKAVSVALAQDQRPLMRETAVQRTAVDFNNPTPAQISHLQRTVGNQAVRRAAQRMVIQRKMTLGPVGDKYEDEADSVTKQVVQTLGTSQPMQRQEDEDELQMKPISTVQRQEEDDELQAKGDSMLGGGELSNNVETAVSSAKSGGSPMSNDVRAPMEQAFNADFSSVKVHTGGESDTLNRSLNARAFTSGSDIFFRNGEYNPGNSGGQELLAHELTHTVQQGAVSPNVQTKKIQRAFWDSAETKQNKSNVKRDALIADKANLRKIREAFWKLQDKDWALASSAITDLEYTYAKEGWWGQTKGSKWGRGVLNLNPLRKEAKALIPEVGKKPDNEIAEKVSTIAKTGAKEAAENKYRAANIKNAVQMSKKVIHYLWAAVPPAVKSMISTFSSTEVDVSDEVQSDLETLGGGQEKSERVLQDEETLKKALESGEMSNRGFHGSASWLLQGLGNSDGKLLSQQRAFEAGLLKTGEGTTFSSGASLKKDVYIGEGETGFGTAASYAMAPSNLTSYNVSLFSDVELAKEIDTHQKIGQLLQVMSFMEDKMKSGGRALIIEKVKKQAKALDLDLSDSGYSKMLSFQNDVQIKEMLGKLQKEQQSREEWEDEDPRRKGGTVNPDNYPILLEFGLDEVDVKHGSRSREENGDYRLAGESTVSNEVDLTNGRLKVVYCPEQFINRTALQLITVFGEKNKIEIRALESITGALSKHVKAEKTFKATYGQLAKQQKSLDVKIKAQRDLAESMGVPDKIYGGEDGTTELTKIELNGKLVYVDENNKVSMHENISKMMTDDAPVQKQVENLEAVMMMGAPGSGKSSIIDLVVPDKEKFVIADPDKAKQLLPEYQRGIKSNDDSIAGKVHSESKKIISDYVVPTAIKSQKNLLYDGTGVRPGEYSKLIEKLKSANYKITLAMPHISGEEGWKRVEKRREETGRGVPERIVKHSYGVVPGRFFELVPKVDEALLFDNMKEAPELAWQKTKDDIRNLKEKLGIE